MATIFGSCATAIETGTVTLPRTDILEAILACTEAHLDLVLRGAAGEPRQAEALDIAERLRRYICISASKLVRLGRDPLPRDHDHDACPGYVHDRGGRREYLFSEYRWRAIFGAADAATAKRELNDRGLLSRPQTRYATRRNLIVGYTKVRVHVVAVKQELFREARGS